MNTTTYRVDFDDDAEREAQYNVRKTISIDQFNATLDRYRFLSEQAAARTRCILDLPYDAASGMTLDSFLPEGIGPHPVFVFIHGGAWRILSSKDSAFMAENFTRHGIAVAAVDYTLAPRATMDEIARQVRACIHWIHQNGRRYALDPERIYVGGHSAGAHLTGVVLAAGWHHHFGVPTDIVRGAFAFSGVFDLRPVMRTFMNEWLRLDATLAETLSPALQPVSSGGPVHLFWGELEPEAFSAQALLYREALRGAGVEVTAAEVPARNHFDLILDLADEASELSRACHSVILGRSRA